MKLINISLLAVAIASPLAMGADLVTTQNYVRAESDMQLKDYATTYDAFGKFAHSRGLYDVTNQITIHPNMDTLYTFGVFDLAQPLLLNMPESDRYQSAMIVSQDHSTFSLYEGEHTITKESVGTRFALVLIRTFVDPNNKSDLKKSHELQDKITVSQKSVGSLDIKDWDRESLVAKRKELIEIASMLSNFDGMLGKKEELNPVMHLLGTAWGWGGLPNEDVSYSGAPLLREMMAKPYTPSL